MSKAAEKKKDALSRIRTELSQGMELPKCRKCGCMKETLEGMRCALPSLRVKGTSSLSGEIKTWLGRMQPIQYACLGCAYCFPAVATNIHNEAFSELAPIEEAACGFEPREGTWPPVAGEYFACCTGETCSVAVTTLSDVGLAERLAEIGPEELCIVGKTETENIGIDKVIKNTITNPTIRYLVVAGQEPRGHLSGDTLLALGRNGVDADMRVIGSNGKRPVLKNVRRDEVEAFRRQVQVIDMIGCTDEKRIVDRVKELARQSESVCGCPEESTCGCAEEKDEGRLVPISRADVVQANEPSRVEMDRAGYFVILPRPEEKTITVEHYSYDNVLLRTVEGSDARSIYWTIIENGWVTLLSHAAYLGRELEKAELSMKYGFKYLQDGI